MQFAAKFNRTWIAIFVLLLLIWMAMLLRWALTSPFDWRLAVIGSVGLLVVFFAYTEHFPYYCEVQDGGLLIVCGRDELRLPYESINSIESGYFPSNDFFSRNIRVLAEIRNTRVHRCYRALDESPMGLNSSGFYLAVADPDGFLAETYRRCPRLSPDVASWLATQIDEGEIRMGRQGRNEA